MPLKRLRINLVGSHTVGMTGEQADEVNLSDALEKAGHKVTRVPRDTWKAHCDGESDDSWTMPDEEADFSIIAKWHHFTESKYAEMLPGKSIYWTWDWMEWPNPPDFHKAMIDGCDLHLTNDYVAIPEPYKSKSQYFPMDVTGDFDLGYHKEKNDVVFFGSCFPTGGRIDLLTEVNKHFDLKIYSQDHEKWKQLGFNAFPPVWKEDLGKVINESKICLQISIHNECWGYWSNRVGKIISAGGFMLAKYVPGMDMAIGDRAAYFKDTPDALEKIEHYLKNDRDREDITSRIDDSFDIETRIIQLSILLNNLNDS